MSSSTLAFIVKPVVVAVLLELVVVVMTIKPEEVCKALKGKEEFYTNCLNSQVVKQKEFIPKHLRPPWLNIPDLFEDNELKDGDEKKGSKCYACYKGRKASQNKVDDEEYCACQYEGGAPNVGFGKLFGTIKFVNSPEDTCLEDFYKIALMPKCGNENYDHIKHCAIVHFYKNEPNTEPGDAEFKQTLVLLDGCVTGISDGSCPNAKVTVQFKEPSSGFFSGNCGDEMKTVLDSTLPLVPNPSGGEKSENGTEIETVNDINTFTLPVLLQHRKCSGLGSASVSDVFEDITITIDGGKCGGQKKSFSLRDLDSNMGRVQEMRGIELKMDNGNVEQWTDENRGYNYTAKSEQKWQPTELSSILGNDGKSKMDSY